MSKRQIQLRAFIPSTPQHSMDWRHHKSPPQDHLNLNTPLNGQNGYKRFI